MGSVLGNQLVLRATCLHHHFMHHCTLPSNTYQPDERKWSSAWRAYVCSVCRAAASKRTSVHAGELSEGLRV